MDENTIDSNTHFYGANAGTSGDTISASDLALLEKGSAVEVRDGDDLVEIETPEDNPEGDQNDAPEGDQPKEEGEKKPEGEPTIEEQVQKSDSDMKGIQADLESRGVDVDALIQSYASNGEKFADSDMKALADAGYSKAAVDAIMAGAKAVNQAATKALQDSVGGQEAFNALSQFAVDNAPDMVEAFNSAQERGDLKTAKVVLQGIQSAYKAKFGSANKMISGTPGNKSKAVQAQVGYSERSEMTKDMSDPRYGRDNKFTQMVYQKVAATTAF